ncbi:hypothetical protein ACKXGF_04930 [Alkalibacillus sp. S2W]|uniref:hypothetical protein n=1 Tax=Alkalibacillus sp. S2W TaxID=3386553 RepID=UPI00398D5151
MPRYFKFIVACIFMLGNIAASLIFYISIFVSIFNDTPIIDEDNINFVSLIVKSSLFLIGSLLTGFIAIYVHFLQISKEDLHFKKDQELLIEKVQNEHKSNIKVIRPIYDSLKELNYNDAFALLNKDDSQLRELLYVYNQKLDVNLLNHFEPKIYGSYSNAYLANWNSMRKIKLYLSSLLDLRTEEATKAMFEGLYNELGELLKEDE